MKTLLVLLSVCAAALALSALEHMVKREVHQLLATNPSITIDACTDQCDALFALADDGDETLTDQLCATECTRELTATTHAHHTGTGHHHHHTTTAPSPTVVA